MRRTAFLGVILVFLLTVLTLPALAGNNADGVSVVVNGQPMYTPGYASAFIVHGHTYVSVTDFAWLVGADYKWTGKDLTFAGKEVTWAHPYGPLLRDGHLYAPLMLLAAKVGASLTWSGADRTVAVHFAGQTPAQRLGLPVGVTRISGVVPHVGEQWANPHSLPLGPVYSIYRGKVVSFAFRIAQADLAAGKAFTGLQVLKLAPVDHMDLDFHAPGRDGQAAYTIHAYFISAAEQQAIAP